MRWCPGRRTNAGGGGLPSPPPILQLPEQPQGEDDQRDIHNEERVALDHRDVEQNQGGECQEVDHGQGADDGEKRPFQRPAAFTTVQKRHDQPEPNEQTGPQASQPITLYEYKGKLMSKVDYDTAVERDKIFKSKKPATQASKQG